MAATVVFLTWVHVLPIAAEIIQKKFNKIESIKLLQQPGWSLEAFSCHTVDDVAMTM